MVNVNIIIEFRSCIMWENVPLGIRALGYIFHFDAIADIRAGNTVVAIKENIPLPT